MQWGSISSTTLDSQSYSRYKYGDRPLRRISSVEKSCVPLFAQDLFRGPSAEDDTTSILDFRGPSVGWAEGGSSGEKAVVASPPERDRSGVEDSDPFTVP